MGRPPRCATAFGATHGHAKFEEPAEPRAESLRYRGGKICLDIHFAPLWRPKAVEPRLRASQLPFARRTNVPKFGIAHALSLAGNLKWSSGACRWDGASASAKALGPWLAAEIPYLIEAGVVTHRNGLGTESSDRTAR